MLNDYRQRVFYCVLFFLFFVVSGCDQISNQITQSMHKGTLKGVEACLKENKSTLLSEVGIRKLCVAQHQTSRKKYIPETAKVDKNLTLSGYLTNPFSDFIITEVDLEVNVYDGDGEKFTVYGTEDGLWAEPGAEYYVVVSMDTIATKVRPSKSCADDSPRENCKAWGLNSYSGIKINVK